MANLSQYQRKLTDTASFIYRTWVISIHTNLKNKLGLYNLSCSSDRVIAYSSSTDFGEELLCKGVLVAETLSQKCTDRFLAPIIWNQRVSRIDIAVPECRARHSLTLGFVDDPMPCALIDTAGPSLDHIATIDDIEVLQGRYTNPLLAALVPNFEAVLSRLLEQNGDTTKIGVSADTELTLASLTMWWISDHLHGHNGPFRKFLNRGSWLPKPFKEDGPYILAQLASLLVVLPDRTAKVSLGEIGPHIRPIETRELNDRVLATNKEALLGYK